MIDKKQQHKKIHMSAHLPRKVDSMMALLKTLYPLHRTINSDDTEKSIRIIGDYIGRGFKTLSFAPGQPALNWSIPPRYTVDEAYIECRGKRYADFCKSNLSVVSYSVPISKTVSHEELRQHIHTRPDVPNEIPWVFKYYKKSWGFCMRHREWQQLKPTDTFRVVIKSRFEKKPFMIGECVIPGDTKEELLWVSNICHPSQVNDSLSGAVVAAQVARKWSKGYKGRFTLRFLFLPETIGSIVWFSKNKDAIRRIRFGMFCETLGNRNRFLLKLSKQGNTPLDRIAKRVLSRHESMGETKVIPFRQIEAGNDELVMNGVGINIPTVSFTRWPFQEYHTSADNPSNIHSENLKEGLVAAEEMIQALNHDRYPVSTVQGPIKLSRYGLWVSPDENLKLNTALTQILLLLDGQYSVADIAEDVGLDIKTLMNYLKRFKKNGLIRWNQGPWNEKT